MCHFSSPRQMYSTQPKGPCVCHSILPPSLFSTMPFVFVSKHPHNLQATTLRPCQQACMPCTTCPTWALPSTTTKHGGLLSNALLAWLAHCRYVLRSQTHVSGAARCRLLLLTLLLNLMHGAGIACSCSKAHLLCQLSTQLTPLLLLLGPPPLLRCRTLSCSTLPW